MVARLADIKDCIVVGSLPGGGQHRRCAALQLADLCRHAVVCGICKTAVKITGFLQIKKPSHLL